MLKWQLSDKPSSTLEGLGLAYQRQYRSACLAHHHLFYNGLRSIAERFC